MQSDAGELIDFALFRLREGTAPGKVKREIHAAGAGWRGIEVNRALATAILQFQMEPTVAGDSAVEVEPKSVEAKLQSLDSTGGFSSVQSGVLPLVDSWALMSGVVLFLILAVVLAVLAFKPF